MRYRVGVVVALLIGASQAWSAAPAAATSPDVVISQLFGGGGNNGSPYQNDFVELYNRSSVAVALTGWSVQYASAMGTTWQVTNLAGVISPGSHYLVQEASAGLIGATLPPPDASPGTIAMSSTTGKVALSSSTTPLSGTSPTGPAIRDFVGYGTANAFEGSGAAPAPSSATADLRAGAGCVDSDDNAADFATGVPSPRNSATPVGLCPGLDIRVEVSQVYGGGGSPGAPFTNDFVELFNPGNIAVGLSGWSVQYASATGSTWAVTTLSGVIAPGGYFLVGEASGGGAGAALPTSDVAGVTSLAATTGKVALVNTGDPLSGTGPSGTGIVDFVGYGASANGFEGAAPAPTPDSTTSVQRSGQGCIDTDDNGNDFVVGTPTPRNAASPPTACSGPVVTHVVSDFDGNGTTDRAVFRPDVGGWYIDGGDTTFWGLPGDIPVSGDYDGNGTTDLAVFRPDVGGWYLNGAETTFWGLPGDIPAPGDYDGNGTTDIAVFRPSTGGWWIQGSGDATYFGLPGDVPVPGDYNDDGTTDIAVFRPSTGAWFILGAAEPTYYGLNGDIPVPGDYDGNGTDLAVFRPSTGAWYTAGAAEPTYFGLSGDIPVPGDYDGNSTIDIAVWRPDVGAWYVDGAATAFWGQAGDRPAPLPSAIRDLFFT